MAESRTHLALYRKYRPAKFDEIEGQEHVVNSLRGAIGSGRIAHAYLFSGTRGTGKTSIARIFAREIGCSDTDLYEIDAASNRGIDDVRELREAVKTLPFESKYKVYIIDEVHMLTKEAFNALLKTLEEPPAHAVFILATTEPHKLPDTVISRCQHFTFKKPEIETLGKLLAHVAKKEGRELDKQSAALLALLGDGSFRDAFGALEKVFSSTESKKITGDDVERISGTPGKQVVRDFISALARKDAALALSSIARAKESGVEMNVFLKMVLTKLRVALLFKFSPDMAEILSADLSSEDTDFLRGLSEHSQTLFAALRELLDAERAVSRSFIPELPIELVVIKLFQQNG